MLLVASIELIIHHAYPPGWNIPVALLPMVGGFAMAWAVVRQMRRLDEMWFRIQLEAMAFAFLVTVVLSFSYGFLENAGLPRLSMFAVWPVMSAGWIIGSRIAARHYRR